MGGKVGTGTTVPHWDYNTFFIGVVKSEFFSASLSTLHARIILKYKYIFLLPKLLLLLLGCCSYE